ncbi:pseudouridine synthase [Mortierella sp. GBAus27b]|nr:multisubstrate pseudouridine synthase 7 [Mortierella sp. GBA43]KAI8359276.1 pseudouridine synthase [Mortierella sp. GBAus27b]
MTERAHTMSEDEVGIRTFVDPSIPGFSAIIKQRYADFLVNEVDRENRTVQLTSYGLPTPNTEQAQETSEQSNSEMSDDDKLAQLSALLGDDAEVMDQIKKMLLGQEKDLEFVNLKPQEDKAKRTAIHKMVKERFSGRMVSETVDGVIRVRLHQRKDNFDTRSKGRTESWKSLGGEFCRFCLFKENRETMEAINFLAGALRVPNKVFTIAGTKDRRGVTCQWVTAHKLKAERLSGLNKSLRNMRLGNFSYVPRGLKLGDLNGNRFMITLRNVLVDSEETLNKSMVSLRDRGFINYFGMQRFGTGSVGTHEVGAAVLRAQWEAVIHLILKPRLGEGPDLEKARKHWAENQDPKEALKLFPKRWVAETQVLWSYQKAGHLKNHFDAFNNIPRNLKLMYIHAYQSYVWNHMVTERIRLYGLDKPVVGDLVAENKAALDTTDDVEDEKGGASREDTGSHVRAKVLTEEDVDQYTIYDVILPMPGYDVIYPTHAIGDKYKELMAKDGLDPHKMRHPNKEFSLPGSYRTFACKPENVEWEIVRYNEANVPLTLTDLEKMENKPKPEGISDGKYLALILNLTLRSSQYATMAIREVCKQDTTAAFQSSLNPVEETTATAATTDESPDALTAGATTEGDDCESSTKRGIEQVDGVEPAPAPKSIKE